MSFLKAPVGVCDPHYSEAECCDPAPTQSDRPKLLPFFAIAITHPFGFRVDLYLTMTSVRGQPSRSASAPFRIVNAITARFSPLDFADRGHLVDDESARISSAAQLAEGFTL
jgi:hypothetical protein